MSKVANNLNKILDIEPDATDYTGDDIVVPDSSVKALPAPQQNTEVAIVDSETNEDYILARKTFRKLIATGEKAVEDIGVLAVETEHPRAFEVMATLMNTLKDTAKELMANQVVKRQIVGAPEKKIYEPPGITVDKAVFVGTLSEIIEKKKLDGQN